MPAHGEVLADEIDAEIKKLVATLDPLSDEEWRRTAPADGWPVGLVAFHIALGLERQAGWVEQALEGGPPHQFSWDVTNQMNAALANAGILPSKPFVLAGLPVAAARLCALLRAVSDADLARVALSSGGKTASIESLMKKRMMQHISEHGASIRDALGD